MSKKRIAITVLLSAILAFLTACCVLNLAKKPMLINKQVNNVSENQQSQTEQRKSNVQSSVERVELKKKLLIILIMLIKKQRLNKKLLITLFKKHKNLLERKLTIQCKTNQLF